MTTWHACKAFITFTEEGVSVSKPRLRFSKIETSSYLIVLISSDDVCGIVEGKGYQYVSIIFLLVA